MIRLIDLRFTPMALHPRLGGVAVAAGLTVWMVVMTEGVVQRTLDLGSAPEVYRPALIAELRDRPYEFDIQVQLCADLARMPVEDVTIEWPEALSPFVTVAKLRIPQQDISGDDNLEKMDALSFTPWRVTVEHRPLGNIMRARKEVYRHSSMLRHKLNRQERTEPRSADDVLAVQGRVPPRWW